MSDKKQTVYSHGEVIGWSIAIFLLSALFFGGFFGGIIAGASYVYLRGYMKKEG